MLHVLKIVAELFTKQGSWRKINTRTSKGGPWGGGGGGSNGPP